MRRSTSVPTAARPTSSAEPTRRATARRGLASQTRAGTACSTRPPRPATTATARAATVARPTARPRRIGSARRRAMPASTPSPAATAWSPARRRATTRTRTAGDGCDSSCQLEPGWTCPQAGARCVPRCGDGTKLGFEQCDDGNTSPGDGCSDACRVEPGFACPTPGQACHRTTCGDGVKEGARSLRRRKHLRRRRLRRRLPRRTGLHGNERLHVPLRRRAEAAGRGVRRRKRRLRRRLLGDVHARTQLGLPRRQRRRRRQPGGACHLPRLPGQETPNGHPNFGAGRLGHDRHRHGPGDAGGGPQAGDGQLTAAERVR